LSGAVPPHLEIFPSFEGGEENKFDEEEQWRMQNKRIAQHLRAVHGFGRVIFI